MDSIRNYLEKYIAIEDVDWNFFVSKLKECQKLGIANIYKTNIEIASYFYNVPKEKIITNNFNRPQKLIERLEKKINHKHREQIKKNKYN